MGLIALEGMRFHAYHGFYEEERVVGNDFVLDVYIETNFSMASASDDLYQTINYETVYEICKVVMREPVKLLETIADRISMGLKHQFQNIQTVKVRVKKLHPPVGGVADCSYIESDESYLNACGRCNRPIICYGDSNCWCQDITVHPRTQEAIMQQYKRCLCRNCLKHFAN
jgi:dihydroneopterin aldolase